MSSSGPQPAPPTVARDASKGINPVAQFWENRAKFTLDQLRPYLGQWVAFSKDGAHIVAADPDLVVLGRKLVEAGQDPQQVTFEQIWPGDEICLGGAELL